MGLFLAEVFQKYIPPLFRNLWERQTHIQTILPTVVALGAWKLLFPLSLVIPNIFFNVHQFSPMSESIGAMTNDSPDLCAEVLLQVQSMVSCWNSVVPGQNLTLRSVLMFGKTNIQFGMS